MASVSSSPSWLESEFGTLFQSHRRRFDAGSSLQEALGRIWIKEEGSPGHVFKGLFDPWGVSVLKQLEDVLEELLYLNEICVMSPQLLRSESA
jgi:hypothetical protein